MLYFIFCRHNSIFIEITSLLEQFPDVEKMLTGLTYDPKTITRNTVRTAIDTLIFMKHSVKLATQLSIICKNLLDADDIYWKEYENSDRGKANRNSTYVQEFITNFSNSNLFDIEQQISNLFSESTTFSKSSQEMRFQECFAIKSGVHGLLDVSRKTYLITVEEIHEVTYKSCKINNNLIFVTTYCI